MTQAELEKYADTMIWGLNKARKQPFAKKDVILVQYDLAAMPLAEALFSKLLKMGMNPVARMVGNIRIEKALYQLGDDDQLKFIAEGQRELYDSLNGSIFLRAPESITHLKDIDPSRIAIATVARKFMREIINKRDEQGLFGWTLCMMPTEALAEHAGMTMAEYTEQIKKACFLDKDDPAAEWERIFNEAAEIKNRINSMPIQAYRMESANMDLEITPGEKRKWIGISGHNIPSFELFISPDWRGTRGLYYADQPSYRNGNLVEGVKLEFKGGRVVKASADKGEEFLKKQLEMDEGASQLGEYSLTDRRFSNIDRFMANTLFDENFGGDYGNSHLAVGSSYSDTYNGDPAGLTKELKQKLGFNDSALHWDLVNTEPKTVKAILKDGSSVLIYENGEFQV